jgi:hypothetical protein
LRTSRPFNFPSIDSSMLNWLPTLVVIFIKSVLSNKY